MTAPRVLVLRTAGTNCDEETAHAWRLAGAEPVSLHVGALMQRPSQLDEFAILTIPGGFSYGDDISAGKILAQQLIHHMADPLRAFVDRGGLVLGICNGFQVLVKAGLLPGWSSQGGLGSPRFALGACSRQTVTLTQNDSARFETRWIHMRTGNRPNAFLPSGLTITLPIAHGEGKLVSADGEVRQRLHAGGHIALTYCDESGRPGPYPINPNGSEDDIAGLCDETGRVLGLMPHPERYVDPLQHPAAAHHREHRPDGRIFFETAVANALSL